MYKLKTPNEQYNGVTEGVPFSKGVGQTDNKNIRNILVNDYKYEDITDYEKTVKEFAENTLESTKEVANALTELSEEDKESVNEGEASDEDENENANDAVNEEDAADEDQNADNVIRGKEGIDIDDLSVPQLKELAKDLNLSNYSKLTKDELIDLITNAENENS